jgi:hypothetical protein
MGALEQLAENQYPHFMLLIRHRVVTEFDGDEAEASKQLETYCTAKCAEEAMDLHRSALKNARAVLARFEAQKGQRE